MEAVYDHLVNVLTEKFEVDAARIRPDASLAGLDMDSLAVVEFFVTLQEHWNIPLDEGDAASELTLEQLAETVQRHLRAGEGASRPGGGR